MKSAASIRRAHPTILISAAAALLVGVAGSSALAADKASDPPVSKRAPSEDTARYVAWMASRGKPIKGKPREDVALRVGDWGFFDHGAGPGQFSDRTALDRTGRAVMPTAKGDKGEWHAFLATPGLDAAGALSRIAWLFRAAGITPATAPPVSNRDRLTAPSMTTADGTITFRGWLLYPPNMSSPMRITITATAAGATIVHESAK